MPSTETQLYELLANSSDITALVGDRIYPVYSPITNDALPSLIYHNIYTAPANTAAGASGLTESSWQITCWASTYLGAAQLSAIVCRVLGSCNTESFKILLTNVLDVSEVSPENEQLTAFGRLIEFFIWYKE